MKLAFELPPDSSNGACGPLLRSIDDPSRHQDAILRHWASISVKGTRTGLRGNPGGNREGSTASPIRCYRQYVVIPFEVPIITIGTLIGNPISSGVPVE